MMGERRRGSQWPSLVALKRRSGKEAARPAVEGGPCEDCTIYAVGVANGKVYDYLATEGVADERRAVEADSVHPGVEGVGHAGDVKHVAGVGALAEAREVGRVDGAVMEQGARRWVPCSGLRRPGRAPGRRWARRGRRGGRRGRAFACR